MSDKYESLKDKLFKLKIVRVQAKEWNQIETLEDAMYKLGLDHPLVQVYRNNKYLQEDSEKDGGAMKKVKVGTEHDKKVHSIRDIPMFPNYSFFIIHIQ